MAGKSRYSDKDKALAYTTLVANDGNIHRTAADMGVARATVRRWKQEFEDNPPDTSVLDEVVDEWLDVAKPLQTKILKEIERQVDAKELKGAALVTAFGVVNDKVTRVEGITSKSRVDHVHHLPSAEEARALLGGLLTGAIESGRVRQAELIDAELMEQAEDATFFALPSSTS